MSRGLNKIMIIGNLGREPEMRYTPSGRPVTTFSVGTSRSWNAEGERRRGRPRTGRPLSGVLPLCPDHRSCSLERA